MQLSQIAKTVQLFGLKRFKNDMPVLGLAGRHWRKLEMQVRMADQAMYHQGNQSVFVGGRLWTLLPPPANEKEIG